MIVLIDNGHGVETPGKRSPDGRLREYKYCREIAQEVSRGLCRRGIDARLLVPEDNDTSITERCRRVNALCAREGAGNVVLLSIHNNAAGNGGWYNASGWMCLVDDAASAKAKTLATLLFDEAAAQGLKTRRPTPTQKWYLYSQALGRAGVRLGLLRGTKCPAVLTENMFQDNKEDVDWLLSKEGRKTIVDIHVEAITKYVRS